MTSRSRTLLFLNFRNSFKGTRIGDNERTGLISDDRVDTVVEMNTLPPRWVDIVDEIGDEIAELDKKVTQMEGLYKKLLLPGFDDRQDQQQHIETMTLDITKRIQLCQKKIQVIHSNRSNDKVKQNIQISLATKLQEISTSFRKLQSNYLKKLRGQEVSKLPTVELNVDEDVWTDTQLAQVSNNEHAISQREKEINELAKSILGLADIFKELQTMVIDQGTLLDRIDYNVEQTNVHLEAGHQELIHAEKYQNNKYGLYCIIFLAVVVTIMIIIIFVKISLKKK